MTTDALIARDGELAQLTPETIERLNDCLPPFWSHGNPVDVLGDGGGFSYGIYSSGGTTATVRDAQIQVLNAAFDYGFYTSSSWMTASEVELLSGDGSFDYGIYNTAVATTTTDVSGVRNSCDMLAMKRLFTRADCSASRRRFSSSVRASMRRASRRC